MASGTGILGGVAASFSTVAEAAASLEPRRAARDLVEQFREHDLIVEAGAIAFRVLLALTPCLLFLFALMGFLGLDSVWHDDIAPDLQGAVSPAAFKLIDDAVTHVLSQQQLFWVTLGAGIAVWEISGVVRGVGKVLDRIYGVRESKPLRETFPVSLAIAAACGLLMLAATSVVRLGPLALDELWGSGTVATAAGFLLRWLVAAGLLLVAIGLIVRTAPNTERPLPWVTFGALAAVACWAASSIAFGLYLTQIADYGSIFGNLATIFVLLEYLYLAGLSLLAGLALNRIVERRA
jgi:membrane protein